MISKLQMSQQFLVIMLSLPRHLTVQLGPYLLSVPGPPGRHMVCRARKYVRKKFANPRKNKKFLFRISVNCVGYPRSQMKTIATSALLTKNNQTGTYFHILRGSGCGWRGPGGAARGQTAGWRAAAPALSPAEDPLKFASLQPGVGWLGGGAGPRPAHSPTP